MASVKLFLREYDKQQQNETITERNVEIPAVPLNGQSILVTVNGRLRSFLVTGTYIPADGTPTIAAFVFAMAMATPYQEAVRIGIEGDDLSLPSHTAFEGGTVKDLMAFLNGFPPEMVVRFNDDRVLDAKTKGELLVLRLGDRNAYQ